MKNKNPYITTKGWRFKQLMTIPVCAFIYAVAIKYFIMPSKVILTGTEGISVSISYFYDSPALFIPFYIGFQFFLLIFAFIWVGKKFAIMSAMVIASVALLLVFLPSYQFADPAPINERLLLVIFAGILSGTAKATTMRMGLSTGDEDIVTLFFAYRQRKNIGFIVFAAGGIAVLFGLSLTLFKTMNLQNTINQGLYTAVYLFINAQTIDILYKRFKLSSVVIITENPTEVGNMIQEFSDKRTYTSWAISGGYTKQDKSLIQAIITQEELPFFVPTIKRIDPSAFIYFHQISGLAGNFHIERVE